MFKNFSYHIIAFLGIFVYGVSICDGLLASSSFSLDADLPEWNNPKVIHVGTEDPRASFFSYKDRQTAFSQDKSSSVLSLNGDWKFKFGKNPSYRIRDFFAVDFDDGDWNDLPVPSNWQIHGYGKAFNINTGYGFDVSEFKAPHEGNEIGSYRKAFTLPDDWKGERQYLYFGAVSSAFYLWVNGEAVGYSQGSKTPAEFDVTKYLKKGKNTVAVLVFRWSDASLNEDQDAWRLSGIHRDVYLWSVPKTHIKNINLLADLENNYKDGSFEISVWGKGTELESQKTKIEVFNSEMSPVALSKPLNYIDGKANWSVKIPNVATWSAEGPYLYNVLVSHLDEAGHTHQAIPLKIGFRNVKISNGRFLVNGKAVLIKGVNRPDHDGVTGHYVSKEQMVKDMKTMKRNNINAIRTAHYPNAQYFYDLCNEFGFYVQAEANLENHGMLKNKTFFDEIRNGKRWENTHLDRMKRSVERDINHPSIVMWSVGNEFMSGKNSDAMYNWAKNRDPSRPVNSEPAQYGINKNTKADFVSKMYMTIEDMKGRLNDEKEKDFPLILVEYSHAAGNSNGALREYWDIFYADNRAQGGFVWDWKDQGILLPIPNGKKDSFGNDTFSAYGPHFGKPYVKVGNAANMDGLVLTDGRVTPGLRAIKYVYRYLHVDEIDVHKGKFKVINRYDFSNAKNKQQGQWVITENGKEIRKGSLGELDVEAGQSVVVQIDVENINPKPGALYHVLFQFFAKSDSIHLVPEGTLLSWDQFELTLSRPPIKALADSKVSQIELEESSDQIQVKTLQNTLVFSKETGFMTSYIVDGDDLLKEEVRPDFWRAITQNDGGAGLWGNNDEKAMYTSTVWEDAIDSWDLQSIHANRSSANKVMIHAKANLSKVNASIDIISTIWNHGELDVKISMRGEDDFEPLVRFGSLWVIRDQFDHIEWLGRGPYPTYVDRNYEPIGRYQTSVLNNRFDYPNPQESGNKVDVTWFCVLDSKAKQGLVFIGDDLSVNAQAYSAKELNDKKHGYMLNADGKTYVNIDMAQMGVGGEDSWKSPPLKKYQIRGKDLSYHYRVLPINDLSELDSILEQRAD